MQNVLSIHMWAQCIICRTFNFFIGRQNKYLMRYSCEEPFDQRGSVLSIKTSKRSINDHWEPPFSLLD
ncbi:hypothetical protein WJ78_24595 [Burkholderia ubonensis]|nr:hypothetical protein WJ78_24595 [Burkholderia ubonensis]KVP91230.1 hypothetical protein WJ97_03690 [Burkholderia ubonensis]OJB45017.1 hypothetical protein BGV57_06160 [Burkholderia ubonensis]